MNERKVIMFVLFMIVYCMYSVNMWFTKRSNSEVDPEINVDHLLQDLPDMTIEKRENRATKTKAIPLFFNNACSILEVFTQKPIATVKVNKTVNKVKDFDGSNHTIAVIGITVFLVGLVINAIMDVLKVKEEERAMRKLNPDGERRQSLAEFANKKQLRRESSKFSLQLFQIAEAVVSSGEEKRTPPPRESRRRLYARGDSTNSYLSDRKTQADGSAPNSVGDSTVPEPRLVKRQSVAKLFGARPVPMVRRSSFPALPLNPEVQALMLGHRQPSFDSDDEGDGRGRRVRIIRRY